jgi:hypothetical protein
VGTRITTSVVFTGTDGVVADPGVVTCKVRDPSGNVDTYVGAPIVNDGVGLYHLDITIDEAGVWTVEWIGSTTGPNVVECRSFSADEACI